MVIANYNDLFLNLFKRRKPFTKPVVNVTLLVQAYKLTTPRTLKLKVVITYMKLELFCGSRNNYTIQFSLYSSNIV